MNRIEILREKITKLTTLLTEKKVNVTQRGLQARVIYNADGIPETVNIPYIPDNATFEFTQAIEGFLDHEVAHVLFTNSKFLKQGQIAGVGAYHNAVEDIFIETEMIKRFPGSRRNLEVMHNVFVNDYVDNAFQKNPDKVEEFLFIPLLRSYAGQQVFKDYMHDKMHLVKDIDDRIRDFCLKNLPLVNSTEDSLRVSLEIKKLLRNEKQEEQGGEGETPEDKGNGPSDSKEDENDEPQSPANHSDEEQSEKEKQDSKDGGKENSEEKEDEGNGEDDSQDDSDDSEDEKEGKGKGKNKDGEEDSEEDESSEGEGGGESDKDETEDGESGDGSGGDSDEDGEDDSDGENSGEGQGGKGQGTNDAKPRDKQKDVVGFGGDIPMSAIENIEKGLIDFDATVMNLINNDAKEIAANSDYLIYTKDFDVIEKYDRKKHHVNLHPDAIKNMADNVDHMVGSVQRDLERAVAAQNKVMWEGGKRSGVIQNSSLSRLINFGEEKVFKRKYETRAKNTAVTLLIDCSGSMDSMGKIQTATYTAYALAMALERLNIKHEIMGFTTGGSIRIDTNGDAADRKQQYSRTSSLYIPIFKEFDERITTTVKENLASLPSASFMHSNVDGESVEIAAVRLSKRKEERKILIVLSDGNPACSGNQADIEAHLKATVKKVMKSGIEVLGIGIMDRSVQQYYPKNVVISKLQELPTTVIGEIKKILLSR